jgi:hypothetical protein
MFTSARKLRQRVEVRVGRRIESRKDKRLLHIPMKDTLLGGVMGEAVVGRDREQQRFETVQVC